MGIQSPQKSSLLFGQCLSWPNGLMDQDVTWYGGRSWPTRNRVRWGPRSPLKGAQQPPLFGPCLLWPNCTPFQLLLSSCHLHREQNAALYRYRGTPINSARYVIDDCCRRRASLACLQYVGVDGFLACSRAVPVSERRSHNSDAALVMMTADRRRT